jgi:hypothetical protein
MKRFISYLLLVAFAVIFSPRSIWHHHEEEKKSCHHDGHAEHSDADEDCYICDFTLQPALAPVSYLFHFPSQNPHVASATAVPLVDAKSISTLNLRGPPAIAFCI